MRNISDHIRAYSMKMIFCKGSLPIWQRVPSRSVSGPRGEKRAGDLSSPDEWAKRTASWQIRRPIGNGQILILTWSFPWMCLVLIDHIILTLAGRSSNRPTISAGGESLKQLHEQKFVRWHADDGRVRAIWMRMQLNASRQISVKIDLNFYITCQSLTKHQKTFTAEPTIALRFSYLNYHDCCMLTPCFMHSSLCLIATVHVHRPPPWSTSTAPAVIPVAVAEMSMPICQICQTVSEPPQLPVQSQWMQMLSAECWALTINHDVFCLYWCSSYCYTI